MKNRICPVCRAYVAVIVTGACGHEFRLGRASRSTRTMKVTRAAWWAEMRRKTAELDARGIAVGLDELTSHRRRRALTRLRDLYNLERAEKGLEPLRFLDFDPWGAHQDAQKLVVEAFELAGEPDSAWQKRAEQAERLFGVRYEPPAAESEAEIEKWLAEQRQEVPA